MTREYVLSLDLGTTGVRALLIDAAASVRTRAYRPLAVRYPAAGHVEQDAEDMWERSVEVLREVLGESGVSAGQVAGIGVVCQRAATIAWNAERTEPLAPVIGWQDQRTQERVAPLRPMGLSTLASATKFEWWMQNDPSIAKEAAAGTLRFGTPDVWLTSRLTGGSAHVTDPGNAAATALFDNAAGDWAEGLLGLFGVPREALPDVVASNAIVGETDPALLGAAIPVAARAGDQQAAAFGQGVHRPGEAKLTLGTSAMLDLHTGAEFRDAPPGAYALSLWDLADGERAFCVEGTVITAGSAVEWAVELGLAPDAGQLAALAASVPSSDGVFFVPALQGLGTPHADDSARAAFVGLTRGSGRAHLSRALLEGIAHRCVDVAEALELPAGALRVDGGLARSDLLLQLIADYGDLELLRAAELETTALGAAFLAGLATGLYETPSACVDLLAGPTVVRPGLAATDRDRARTDWGRALAR